MTSKVMVRWAGVLAIALASTASAQWTVVNLHPAGADNSYALGVSTGEQAGYAVVGGVQHASLWTGTAASWVDLRPDGAGHSIAYGVGDGQQVGAVVANGLRASLWSGTANSWVDLDPGVFYSQAAGANGGQQVGWAVVSSHYCASLWSGTAGSWVNLSPAGATFSQAIDVSGGQQVGYAYVDDAYRASLWSGTAASWVDLNPAGASYSEARGVDGGQQAGHVVVGVQHASLWSGTADSWVDLHPAGATGSLAYDVYDGQQVGVAYVGGVNHASLWSGTAASWVDLHAFLPAEFSSSYALGIWHDGTFAYVVGYGLNDATGRGEALMWMAPSCTGAETAKGKYIAGENKVKFTGKNYTPGTAYDIRLFDKDGNLLDTLNKTATATGVLKGTFAGINCADGQHEVATDCAGPSKVKKDCQ